MKKTMVLLNLLLGLVWSVSACDQSPATGQKMSVEERMAKARAAKAERKEAKTTQPDVKATPADYKAPVDKVLKGPNGEVVHTGERGAKFYINRNGNKTYLSSNQ